jgi:cell division transport system permease protein
MNFWLAVLRQLRRNLRETWPSQIMTFLTLSLSVLIFSLFLLIYMNMPALSRQVGDNLQMGFHLFTQALRLVVLLSGGLLALTAIFMVSHTIRLTIMSRADEFFFLNDTATTENYIRMPFMLEGFVQGLAGSLLGLSALYALFLWISRHVAEPKPFTEPLEPFTAPLSMAQFIFFAPEAIVLIMLLSIILCAVGSHFSIHKYLRS